MSDINKSLMEHSVKCIGLGFLAGIYTCIIIKIFVEKYKYRKLQKQQAQAQQIQNQEQPQQEEEN